MLLCAPLLAGWLIIGLSQAQVWIIYLGRILQGVGVMSSVTQVSYLVIPLFPLLYYPPPIIPGVPGGDSRY